MSTNDVLKVENFSEILEYEEQCVDLNLSGDDSLQGYLEECEKKVLLKTLMHP